MITSLFFQGLGGLTLALCLVAQQGIGADSQTSQQPSFPCFTQHGRLTAFSNGIAVRLWLIGTKRVVHPEGDLKLPPDFDRYLDPMPPHSYGIVYGDFEICPLEADVPGQMRRVRIGSAERLVVDSLDGSR